MADSIFLCIPGPWEDRRSFLEALVAYGDAIAAGQRSESKGMCVWQFEEADPRLERAFHVSLMPDEPEGVAETIGGHHAVLYLIEPKERGTEAVARMIGLANLCLDAGGLGAKVEAAGKAFSAEKWRRLSESPISAYEQMVLRVIEAEDGYYSCGMHQFGHPDTYVETEDFQEAVNTARSIERYQINEKPDRQSGHTFGTEEGSQVWRLTHEDHPYHGDEILDRSLGTCRLRKAA